MSPKIIEFNNLIHRLLEHFPYFGESKIYEGYAFPQTGKLGASFSDKKIVDFTLIFSSEHPH